MLFHPILPPRPGTVDYAAQRIYRMLQREERAKISPRDQLRRGEDSPLAQAQSRDAADLAGTPQRGRPTPGGIAEQKREQLDARRWRKEQAAAPKQSLEPITDYGVGERIDDLLHGVG
jgi:hypothetical protein